MKVLEINSVCNTGSTGRIVLEIYNLLKSNGDECCIAYGRGIAPDTIRTYKIEGKKDIIVHVIGTRLLDMHGFMSNKATRKLIEEIGRYQPDIIHLHNIHGYYINIEILFSYIKRKLIPVVWTLHDCWSFTGHCSYFDFVDCEKWRMGCSRCPQKLEYPTSLFLDNSKKNYMKKKKIFGGCKNLVIVTPSIWLKNLVKESFLKEYPVEVINNGIDVNTFNPLYSQEEINEAYFKYMAPEIYKDHTILLGVSFDWDRRKGLEDFIKLAKIIDDKYLIVLVGLSDKQIKQLPSNICGIKRTDSAKELAKLYAGAKFYLNLTYEDNYPTTNIEALSCGCCAITYDTGGSAEPIMDKECVIEKGNIEGVYKIIESKKTVAGGISYMNYSTQVNFEKYIELYKKILKNSNTGVLG